MLSVRLTACAMCLCFLWKGTGRLKIGPSPMEYARGTVAVVAAFLFVVSAKWSLAPLFELCRKERQAEQAQGDRRLNMMMPQSIASV